MSLAVGKCWLAHNRAVCASDEPGSDLLRIPQAFHERRLQLRVEAGAFRRKAAAERQDAEGGNSARVPGCCSGYQFRLPECGAKPIARVTKGQLCSWSGLLRRRALQAQQPGWAQMQSGSVSNVSSAPSDRRKRVQSQSW
jgi:hypothetical protein